MQASPLAVPDGDRPHQFVATHTADVILKKATRRTTSNGPLDTGLAIGRNTNFTSSPSWQYRPVPYDHPGH